MLAVDSSLTAAKGGAEERETLGSAVTLVFKLPSAEWIRSQISIPRKALRHMRLVIKVYARRRRGGTRRLSAFLFRVSAVILLNLAVLPRGIQKPEFRILIQRSTSFGVQLTAEKGGAEERGDSLRFSFLRVSAVNLLFKSRSLRRGIQKPEFGI